MILTLMVALFGLNGLKARVRGVPECESWCCKITTYSIASASDVELKIPNKTEEGIRWQDLKRFYLYPNLD